MKKVIISVQLLIASSLLIQSCEEDQILSGELFYENYAIERVFLSPDRNLFLEGEEPIDLSVVGFSTFEDLNNVAATYFVNGNEIEGNLFTPDGQGVFTVRAESINGVRSNNIDIISVRPGDVDIAITNSAQTTFLTTNPWSTTDFIAEINTPFGQVELLETDSRLQLFANNSVQESTTDVHFDIAGNYDLQLDLLGIRSNTFNLDVRQEPEYDIVEFPVVLHFFGADRLNNLQTINEAFAAVNDIVNNTSLSSDPFENPNKVDLKLRFRVVDTNVIQGGNSSSTSFEEAQALTEDHYWNPNQFINVYVAEGDWSANFPFNPAGIANFPTLLNVELGGIGSVDREPESPIINAVYMNGNLSPEVLAHEFGHLLSLHHPFEFRCTSEGDFAVDTYNYRRTESNEANPVINCDNNSVWRTNIMEWGGLRTIFTFDQRERIRTVIEFGLSLPTPKNRLKSKNKKVVKGILLNENIVPCSNHSH